MCVKGRGQLWELVFSSTLWVLSAELSCQARDSTCLPLLSQLATPRNAVFI